MACSSGGGAVCFDNGWAVAWMCLWLMVGGESATRWMQRVRVKVDKGRLQKAEAPRRRVLRPGLSTIFQSANPPSEMVAVSGAAPDRLCL